MRTRALLIGACLVAFLAFCPAEGLAQEPAVEGRVVFARARDIGDQAGAEALVKSCRQAGFNVLVLQVKEPDGAIYFSSKRFLGARAPSLAKFDPLKAVLDAAGKEGLIVHAGLCAFLEGASSPPVNDHPKWAALSPLEKTTAALEDSPGVWMCPARRPGYADRYLIPMIEELLKNYAVDGIHLDHLSFAGGAGPDSFCFCDYCVREFPRRSRLFYPALPGESFEPPRLVPDPLAGWKGGATALPADYFTELRSRKVMSEYMLLGSYVKRGPSDMDYFFYTYRTDVIRDFCAEVFRRARAISPKLEFSARAHWNAPAAGRFAGQRWTDFGQWFDFLVLDVDRSHLPGEFATYRKLLADVAFYMVASSRSLVHVYAGLSVEDIYREERRVIQTMVEILEDLTANPDKDPKDPAAKLRAAFGRIRASLAGADKKLAGELESEIASLPGITGSTQKRAQIYTSLGTRVRRLITDPPAGFYQARKLGEAIQDLRGAGTGSVALEGAAAMRRLKLWNSLPGILGPAGQEPYRVRPLRTPSAQMVRLFLEKQEQLAGARAQMELLNRRLEEVNALLKPLRTRVDDYELTEREKVARLDGLLLEFDTIKQELARKLTELEQEGSTGTPGLPSPPKAGPDEEEPLPEDADYATLRRKLREKMEEIKIATGQRERAEEVTIQLRASLEKAHAALMQQKQEYLYYISILIAVVCIGLAVVLVVTMLRHRR